MFRMSSVNVNSKGSAAVYSVREAGPAFPSPPVSCVEHHFQWMCQFADWCQPRLANFKANLHHCEYFISVFYMQDPNDESCLALLWSRKDLVWGQESRTTLPSVCSSDVVFSLIHSPGELEFITITHCMYLTLLRWPLQRPEAVLQGGGRIETCLGLGARTGLQPQQRVQTRKQGKAQSQEQGNYDIETKIFKRSFSLSIWAT